MNSYVPNLPTSVPLPWEFLSSLPNLGPHVLWGILLLLAIVVGGVSIVLYYHWIRYGFGDKGVIMAQVFYTIVVLLCFIIMIGSAATYG